MKSPEANITAPAARYARYENHRVRGTLRSGAPTRMTRASQNEGAFAAAFAWRRLPRLPLCSIQLPADSDVMQDQPDGARKDVPRRARAFLVWAAYVVLSAVGWGLFTIIELGEPLYGLLLVVAGVGMGWWWWILRGRVAAHARRCV